ncbi:TolC family outer membrane protein [Cellvibrio japonicus]|uniref:Probable agglutination protein n=1 Tax=Cellvibrio japonicus (strain Ueda107) TaxID=498211 RepID=B3PD27_CELJU|nr:TolC family outer membrane protein [Cellvibrio japonicus]ACE82715.1 probable agglutination protein [Cellvibrio japonicus Ueda107]
MLPQAPAFLTSFMSWGTSIKTLSFMSATFLAVALPVQAQTARDAALQAIESNPDVQASWHEFASSIQDVKVARSGYLPSVDLGASAGRANRDYDGRGSYNTTQGEISLTQMLFDGFRTAGEVKYFDNARLVRYYELLNTVEVTALEAVRAYEDVVRTRELVALARANYSKHREVYTQIEERTHSGVGRRVDLEQVNGRLALAESNLLTEAANLHDVTARYLRVVGGLPGEALEPSSLADTNLPPDIRAALQLAYAGNPGFHAAIKNISAAQAKVTSERSGYYPQASLRARQVTNRNLSGFDERVDPDRFGDESAVELALTYNLYAGGANRAAVRRSLEQVNLAKDQRDQACQDLRQTTQIAYNDARRLREQLLSLEQHKLSSDKVRAAYYEQFNIGQRTLLDLLDAENEYFQASRALIIAQGGLEIAHARSLAAMGKLLVALGISRDGVGVLKDLKVNDSINISDSVCPDQAPTALGRDELITDVNNLSGDALFDVGSSVLKPGATQKLDALIAQIKNTPKVVGIRVEGHTDNTGTDALNIPLSKARAQRVRDYAVLNGLENIPVSVDGFGASRPVADNNTEAGRAANRRVEISITRQP